MCAIDASRLITVQREAHGSEHAHGVTYQPGGDQHASHADTFRLRFWWCLLLTVPVVVTSPMMMDW